MHPPRCSFCRTKLIPVVYKDLSTKSGVFVDKMTVYKDLSTKSGVFVDKSELVKQCC